MIVEEAAPKVRVGRRRGTAMLVAALCVGASPVAQSEGSLLEQARQAEADGRYGDAVALYAQVATERGSGQDAEFAKRRLDWVKRRSTDGYARLALVAAVRRGDVARRAELEAALTQGPRDALAAEGWLVAANAANGVGDWVARDRAYETLVQLDGADPVLERLGLVEWLDRLDAAGKTDVAATIARRHHDKVPERVARYRALERRRWATLGSIGTVVIGGALGIAGSATALMQRRANVRGLFPPALLVSVLWLALVPTALAWMYEGQLRMLFIEVGCATFVVASLAGSSAQGLSVTKRRIAAGIALLVMLAAVYLIAGAEFPELLERAGW